MQITILHNELDCFSNDNSGFSLLIEAEKKILFDFSCHGDILKNAKKIGLDFDSIDFYAISHGHIDHVENISKIKLKQRKPLVFHPLALLPKFFEGKSIGFNPILFRSLDQYQLIPSKSPFYISENIIFLGEIPNSESIPVGNTNFGKDLLPDDSGILIKTDKNNILVTGCTHSGLLSMVEYAEKIIKQKINIVIGGLHLVNDEKKLNKNVAYIQKKKIKVYFGHCVDKKAYKKLIKIGAVKFNTLDCLQFK